MEQSSDSDGDNSIGKIDPDDLPHEDLEDEKEEEIINVRKLSGEELLKEKTWKLHYHLFSAC